MEFDMEEYLEEYLEIEENDLPPQKRMRSKKKCFFTIEEKKKLASLVQDHRSIWCLEEKAHSNLDAINSDWRQISTELCKSVDDCKANWKSLRDSHRYHKAPRKMGKSGSAAGELSQTTEEILNEDNADWEFSACLAFLTPASSKRRTYSSAIPPSSNVFEEVHESQGNEPLMKAPPTVSNYAYNTSKAPKKDVMGENVTNLTQTVADLIQMRRDDRNLNGPVQPPLRNYTLLANLDRVLQKLPEDLVEELGLSFQQQAVAAVQEHKNKTRSPGH